MDPRRTGRGSSFGRSGSGDASNGGSRPVSCSYLTNVRPENRSTLCSVIAQLTEETQPTFEKTLRSRAVCAESSIKFSCIVTGHPVPQLTWYKDDMQLDRYCGLPKYEIFRNGQNHSLHIYNCTLDDAAIYQASASNTKGIVSCSGVLEVGEMNEFRIHQRYFAKLKQKAESKSREAEGKENQEPLRTISPDRAQRKRRSTMEAFMSTPSSTEDEAMEDAGPRAAGEPETRLQVEGGVEPREEKPTPAVTNKVEMVNGVVEASATHLPRAPFVKKKIKISVSTREDIAEEKAMDDRRDVAKTTSKGGQQDQSMEVESTVLNPDFRRKPARKKWEDMEQKSKLENVPNKPLKKEPPSSSATPSPPPRLSRVKQTWKTQSKVQEDEAKVLKQPLAQPRSKPLGVALKGAKAEDATVADLNKKSSKTEPKSVPAPSRRQTVVPSTQTPGQLLGKESVSGQKKTLPEEEVTKMKIPAEVKLFPDQCSRDVPAPQRSRGSLTVKGDPTPAVVQVTRDTRDPARGSSGGQTLLFTDPQKSPVKGLSGDDNTPGCPVPGRDRRSQVDAAIKPVKGTEIQVGEKAAVNEQGGISVSGDRKPIKKETKIPVGTEVRKPESSEAAVVDRSVTHDTPVVKVQEEMEQDQSKTSQTSAENFQEVQIPVPSVISIAELLRSQIKALGLSLDNGFSGESESAKPGHGPGRNEHVEDTGKSVAPKHPDSEKPPKNLAQTLMEIYRLLNESANEIQGSAPETTSPKYPTTPPICVVDTSVSNTDSKDSSEGFMDIAQESRWSNDVPVLIESDAITPEEKVSSSSQTQVLQQVSEVSKTEDLIPVVDTIDAPEFRLANKTKDKNAKNNPEELKVANPNLNPNPNPCLDLNGQLTQQENLSTVPPNPDVSPLLKKRLCPSPIPSATPEELASGARRKIFIPKPQGEETADPLRKTPTDEESGGLSNNPATLATSPSVSRRSRLLQPNDNDRNSVAEKKSPTEEESGGLANNVAILATSPSVSRRSRLLQPNDNERNSAAEKKSPTEEESGGLAINPVILATSPSVSRRSRLLQPNDNDRNSVTEKKSPPEEENGGLSNNPATLATSPSVSRRSRLLQPNDERNSVTEKELLTKEESSGLANNVAILATSPSVSRRSHLLQPNDNERNSAAEKKSPTEKESGGLAINPVILATSPSVSRRSHLLQPNDNERNSAAEKKSQTDEENGSLSNNHTTLATSPSVSRRSRLLQPNDERNSVAEKKSPTSRRRKAATEVQNQQEEVKNEKEEDKPAEKDKTDPRKAPQVIRKIRGENFADSSGHLKLWCQFFNILGDSTVTWYRNQLEIARIHRKPSDESPVNLAIVHASGKDSGVYRCCISNEYGSDSTDFLLNAELMTGTSLREETGVGEEIEMTPLVFTKGVADLGTWGSKFFGRVMVQRSRVGDGSTYKVWRAKVIYGLEPVFESGNTCVIKTRSPFAYAGKEEICLLEKNLELVKQEVKIQNLAREYCKIFSAETRVAENFGPSFEVLPLYLMYRPANTVPYATVETDLSGSFRTYTSLDASGKLDLRTGSELELKCCSLQHWMFEWTHGNLLLTLLEGVETKITNIGLAAKSSGHQGLPLEGNPKVFEQFVSQHQCNYYCGLLGLRSLKVLDSLMTPQKPRGSKSPLTQHKLGGSSSSPQAARKVAGSPKPPRKTIEDQGKPKE